MFILCILYILHSNEFDIVANNEFQLPMIVS